MVRTIDKEARSRSVLSSVIDSFIQTSNAVSSEDICHKLDYSSATIRNIMYELEELGYLTHMHTSAGRIPTDKGYRYYVDILLSQMRLVEEEKERIHADYNLQLKKLEDILEMTSEVLASFTHCASIVALLKHDERRIYYNGASFIVEHPEFKNIDRIRDILKVLEEKKRLLDIINQGIEKKINIYIGGELACKEIANCSMVVSTYGTQDFPLGRIAVLGPRSMNYGQVIPTIEYVSELLSKALEDL